MNTSSLYNETYWSEIDKEIFIDFLGAINSIHPIFISRKDFNEKQGDYLVKKTTDNAIEKYDLFLPFDFSSGEMLEMITVLISKFGLDKYSKIEELFVQIKVAIIWLLREEWPQGKDKLNTYIRDFNVPIYLQKIVENTSLVGKNRKYTKNILWNMIEQRSFQTHRKGKLWQAWDSEILSSIISDAKKKEFEQTFFRKWIDDIRFWMKIFTKKDYLRAHQRSKELDEWEVLTMQKKPLIRYRNEILLRDAIGIDWFISKLEAYRSSGNQKRINKLELYATNKILKELQKYPYQSLEWGAGYKPSQILETKQLQCVGFSLLWHAFLSELWIEHYGLDILGHSCLEVYIWENTYVFDATMKGRLSKVKNKKISWWITQIQHGVQWKKNLEVRNIWDPETILFDHICLNESVQPSVKDNYEKSLGYNDRISPAIKENNSILLQTQWRALFLSWKYEEALEYYYKSILLDDDNYDGYLMQWSCFWYLWRYQEAIDSYNKSIKIDADQASAYAWKAGVYELLKNYKKSMMYVERAIWLEPENASHYDRKSRILYAFGRHRELLIYADEAIDLFPGSAFLYYFKWRAWEMLWKKHASLYIHAATLISPEKFEGPFSNQLITSFDVHGVQVSLFIKNKDYDWLRDYLLDLEN